MTTDKNTLPEWRGMHHLALATPDLDATFAFYRDVLGMVVSDIFPSRAGRGRHGIVFVKPGDRETWGLHFFERPQTAPPAAPEGATAAGPLLHVAFCLPDEAAVAALQERLRAHGIEPTVLHELGGGLFFPDNNGLWLEVTWPKD